MKQNQPGAGHNESPDSVPSVGAEQTSEEAAAVEWFAVRTVLAKLVRVARQTVAAFGTRTLTAAEVRQLASANGLAIVVDPTARDACELAGNPTRVVLRAEPEESDLARFAVVYALGATIPWDVPGDHGVDGIVSVAFGLLGGENSPAVLAFASDPVRVGQGHGSFSRALLAAHAFQRSVRNTAGADRPALDERKWLERIGELRNEFLSLAPSGVDRYEGDAFDVRARWRFSGRIEQEWNTLLPMLALTVLALSDGVDYLLDEVESALRALADAPWAEDGPGGHRPNYVTYRGPAWEVDAADAIDHFVEILTMLPDSAFPSFALADIRRIGACRSSLLKDVETFVAEWRAAIANQAESAPDTEDVAPAAAAECVDTARGCIEPAAYVLEHGLPSRPDTVMAAWNARPSFDGAPGDLVAAYQASTAAMRVATRAATLAYERHGVGWADHAGEWNHVIPGDRLGIGFLFSLLNAWQHAADVMYAAAGGRARGGGFLGSGAIIIMALLLTGCEPRAPRPPLAYDHHVDRPTSDVSMVELAAVVYNPQSGALWQCDGWRQRQAWEIDWSGVRGVRVPGGPTYLPPLPADTAHWNRIRDEWTGTNR